MLTDNAFFLRLWMFWGSAGAQSASSAVHSADPWPYHICTFAKSSAADRCSAFLTVQQNTGSFCQFQSLFSQPLLDLGRLHVTVLRYILNTYTGVITDVFLYLLELGFHLLTAMRAQKRSCHIVKNMSAHSAISYIHSISHLPDHTPDPQANVTQYTFDTPCSFNSAAISSRVVPVV